MGSFVLFQNKALTIKTITLVMSISNHPVFQCSGSQLLFIIVASLLCHLTLNSSASSPFPLPSPILFQVTLLVIFLPLTMSLFAYDTCYLPHGLHVRTTSTYYFPFLSYKKGKIRVGEDVRVRGLYHLQNAGKSNNTEVQKLL